MKTEDELDAEIAAMFDEVKAVKVEVVNGKPKITDEQMVVGDAGEMETVAAYLVQAFREFTATMDRGVDPLDPLRSREWWSALGSCPSPRAGRRTASSPGTETLHRSSGGRSSARAFWVISNAAGRTLEENGGQYGNVR